MIEEDVMYNLIRHTLSDPEFRRKMLSDPVKASEEKGIILKKDQIEAFKAAQNKGLAALLEEQLPKTGVHNPYKLRSQFSYDRKFNRQPEYHEKPVLDSKSRLALVYAPFGECRSPALGISLLKSALTKLDIPCDIHYLNLMLAGQLGTQTCDLIAIQIRQTILLSEWMFAPSLFGENKEADIAYVNHVLWGEYRDTFTPDVILELLRIRECLPSFLDSCIEKVNWSQYDLIGFSILSYQTCASLAMAQRIKTRFPHLRIIFGGANCLGSMGAALFRLFPFVDYVCSGYGDKSFPRFVQAFIKGNVLPSIQGIMVRGRNEKLQTESKVIQIDDMNALPYPDYSDYFAQIDSIRTHPDFEIHVSMEASRGCWWGENRPCTFCGENTPGLNYQFKSPSRLLDEFKYISMNYGKKIYFGDSILPGSYFNTVIPKLADNPYVNWGFEVRVDLNREQVMLMAKAGVRWVQPGIETLSDRILRLIRKGTTLVQNIQVLKWCKQYGIKAIWNFIWGFPGEDPAEYPEMERLVPLLFHLDPPYRPGHVRFDRFSAYCNTPASFGITSLKPILPYRYIFYTLSVEDLNELAYFFEADYSDNSKEYTRGIRMAFGEWQISSNKVLDLFHSENSIHIIDTRRKVSPHEYYFDGLAGRLYLLCDTAQTLGDIMKNHSINKQAGEHEVIALLDQFISMGLMIRSGKKYLSLAVMREE